MYKLTTRSPLRYPGGKSRASVILPLIPQGGSVELALMGQGVEVFGSDIFSPLVDFWQEAIENPLELSVRVLKYLPRSKFYNLQKHFRELPNKLERAAVFFVLNRSSFSGTTLSGGMSPGHKRFTPSAIKRLRSQKGTFSLRRSQGQKGALQGCA